MLRQSREATDISVWSRRRFCSALSAVAVLSPATAAAETPEDRLAARGIILPPPPEAIGSYLPYRLAAAQLFIAGQIPVIDGRVLHAGTVPDRVGIDEARIAARQCGLQLLSIARLAAGSLDRISQVVRLEGFVSSARGFGDQPNIIDAASDLLADILGEAGRHARLALGVSALPRNASVEIAAILELRP